MKVVTPPPEFKPIQHTCGGCGAVVLIEETDIEYHPATSYRDDEYFYANCCLCHSYQFPLDSRDLPALVKNAARNRSTQRYGAGWRRD